MKQVYVAGALAGSNDLSLAHKLYERFGNACEAAGLIAYLPHHNTDPKQHVELDPAYIFETDLAKIRQSDFVVMYLGEPSIGVGYELAKSIDMQIPILALYEEDRKISRLALGALGRYRAAHIYSYKDVDDACKWIQKTLMCLTSKVEA